MSKEIFEGLQKDFPGEAVEQDKSGIGWKRGKDIKFIKYIYLCNRLNEVLGCNGWSVRFETITTEKGKSAKGKPKWIITGKIIIEGEQIGRKEAFGGSESFDSEASAYKSAWTDAFKKCAALLGAGWKTYAGLLDPDNGTQDTPQNTAREENKNDYSEQKNAWSRCRELAKRMKPDDPWDYVVKFVQTKSPNLDRELYKTFPLDKIPIVEKALSEHIKKELDKSQKDDSGKIPDNLAVTKDQIKKLHVLYKKTFADNEEKRREYIQEITGKTSTKDLTKIEAIGLITELENYDPTSDQWS